jgi:hypothetical protein
MKNYKIKTNRETLLLWATWFYGVKLGYEVFKEVKKDGFILTKQNFSFCDFSKKRPLDRFCKTMREVAACQYGRIGGKANNAMFCEVF